MLAYQQKPQHIAPKKFPAISFIQRKSTNSTDTFELGNKPCACGGTCPRCQTKVHLGQAHDVYEREADHVAEQMLSEPFLANQNSVAHRITPLVQQQTNSNEQAPIEDESVNEKINQLANGGQALAQTEQQFFAAHFGRDFSQVRVHLNQTQLAKRLNARAFTMNNHIVFGQGQYSPGTQQGRRLLAHELTHVVQQTISNRQAAQAKLIQRQTIPIPEFDEIDPCIIVPKDLPLPPPLDKLGGQKVCGSYAKKLRELLQGKKGGKKQILCPPGFIPGTAKGYEKKCCKITNYEKDERNQLKPTTIHNSKNCCEPSQIVVHSIYPICCPAGTQPDAAKKNCVKPKPTKFTLPPCPDDRERVYLYCECKPESRKNPKRGVCCPLGQEGSTGTCQTPAVKPDKPKPTAYHSEHAILFNKDRPFPGETGTTGLKNSLLTEGQATLQAVITLLKENPSYNVQLFGRASPEGKASYNMALSKRRAKIILQALTDAGIARSRIIDPSNWSASEGCETIASGVISCGESGASGPGDRQVLANVFATPS